MRRDRPPVTLPASGGVHSDAQLQRAWQDMRACLDRLELSLNAATAKRAGDLYLGRQLGRWFMDGNGPVAWEVCSFAEALRMDENPDLPQGQI